MRAVLHDQGLMRFDSLFEVSSYPCEMLWGPGTVQDAMTWFEQEQPEADEVQVLDRPFLIRHWENRLYLPRRPDIAAGLEDAERSGIWYFVRADSSTDAFGHVRRVVAGGSACSLKGPCQQCAVDTIGAGNWEAVTSLLRDEGINLMSQAVTDARVGSLMRWPRYIEILGDGNWTTPPE